jgi:hypothetical protein
VLKEDQMDPSNILIAEAIPWRGVVRITVRRPGSRGKVSVIENTITDAGRNLLARALWDDAGAVNEIRYLAVGDDNTAPTVADTALGNELFRKVVTSSSAGASVGEAINTIYLAPFDANFQIEELGFYAGAASPVPDSGTLVARVLYSKDKDNLEAIQVERTDTVG